MKPVHFMSVDPSCACICEELGEAGQMATWGSVAPSVAKYIVTPVRVADITATEVIESMRYIHDYGALSAVTSSFSMMRARKAPKGSTRQKKGRRHAVDAS